MAITHAAIAAAGVSLALGTSDPLVLGLAIIGSQLPDIDTTQSAIGQICYPVSHWIEERFPHRSVTHSLAATAAIALVTLSIGYLTKNLKPWAAIPIGHLLACFSDTFTKQGVQLFWPEPAWAISVSNPRRRLKTGGAGELWVLAIAIMVLVLSCYIASSGGLGRGVSQSLGLRDGIIRVYNENAASNQVFADITGVWASDRSRADGQYLILGAAGAEFVVTDGAGVYQTGEQIVVEQLRATIGQPAKTQVQTLALQDQEAIAAIQQLQALHPNASIWLSGAITVDFPEEILLPLNPRQMQTATLSGDRLQMNYHPAELAVLQLRDQYATGTLQVKIIQK